MHVKLLKVPVKVYPPPSYAKNHPVNFPLRPAAESKLHTTSDQFRRDLSSRYLLEEIKNSFSKCNTYIDLKNMAWGNFELGGGGVVTVFSFPVTFCK